MPRPSGLGKHILSSAPSAFWNHEEEMAHLKKLQLQLFLGARTCLHQCFYFLSVVMKIQNWK